MKVSINSTWNNSKANVYFTLTPENEVEKALVRSLYAVQGTRPATFSDGSILIDFYPQGRGR